MVVKHKPYHPQAEGLESKCQSMHRNRENADRKGWQSQDMT